jgi:hypothetical protein
MSGSLLELSQETTLVTEEPLTSRFTHDTLITSGPIARLWMSDSDFHLSVYKQREEHLHEPALLRVAFRSRIRAERAAIRYRKEQACTSVGDY